MKPLSLAALLCAAVVTTGCATLQPMPLQESTSALDVSEKSVLVARVLIRNDNHPSHQPNLLCVLATRAENGKDQTFSYTGPTLLSDNAAKGKEYFVSLSVPPGPMTLDAVRFLRQIPLLITAVAEAPLRVPLDVPAGKVVYLGRIEAVIVPKSADSALPPAGPALPLIDQAVAGFSNGTFQLTVTDAFEDDQKALLARYPYLADKALVKSILPLPGPGAAQPARPAPAVAAPAEGAPPAAGEAPPPVTAASPATSARAAAPAAAPPDPIPAMWMRGSWDPSWDAGSAVAGVRRGETWAFVLGGWAPDAYAFKFATALTWPSSASDPRQSGLYGACSGKDMASPARAGTVCTNASQGGKGGNLKAALGPNVAVEFTRSAGRWVVLDPGAAPAFPTQSFAALWLRGSWSAFDAAGAIPGVAAGHDWTFKVPDGVRADEYGFRFVSSPGAQEAGGAPGAAAFGTCHGYDFVVPLRRSAACPDAAVPSGHAGTLMTRLRPGAVVRFNDQTGAWSVTSP